MQKSGINELFSAIPYLNGGLFSPHEDDFFNYNESKQAANHNMVVVPDQWLKSLFEVLETYNFTIDENTSFDEELSIDPEMLGRIFENLLAEINPETGESARKSTGSYYTPRVIVDYMVDESLYLYVKQKTSISEEKLRSLISYDLDDDTVNPLSNEEKTKIAESLCEIKILDPACGSGAFPIGALQKIVFILQQIDPLGQLWFKKQIKNTPIELRKVIEREFEQKNFDYIRKLGIIRENIYGIDIQPIATEISRLRCFLTLVVDERIDDTLENRGIEPLPNLDFKFVTANTLVGLPTTNGSVSQMGLFEDDQGIKDLKEVRDMFFNAAGFERDQLKLQFVQTQNRMFQKLITEGRRGHADMTAKLTTWDPFSHKSASWFDPEWMFGIKDGFDVIIANPPYIQIKQIPQQDKRHYSDNFKSAVGRFNIFYFFIEISSRFAKKNGLSAFIVPDRILLNTQCVGIRSWLLNEQEIVEIDSFANEVFESAVVDSILIFYRNKRNTSISIKVKHAVLLDTLYSTSKSNLPLSYFIESPSKQFDLSYDIETSNLIKKINAKSVKLGTISETKDGIIQSKIPDVLFIKEPVDEDSKPLLFGKDIDRYSIKYNNNWVNYKPDEMMKIELKRGGGGLRLRVKRIFERPKILTRQTADQIIAAWDKNNYYYSNTLHGTTITSNRFHPNYVLAILNSKLITWYYRKNTAEQGKVFAQVKIELLRLLPILNVNNDQQKHFISIVDEINKHLDDVKLVSEYKAEIDKNIYSLYDLEESEINIIEGSTDD